MTEIAEVAKYIRKELKYAEQYAYEAAKHKEQYPELAHATTAPRWSTWRWRMICTRVPCV